MEVPQGPVGPEEAGEPGGKKEGDSEPRRAPREATTESKGRKESVLPRAPT